MNTGMRTVDLFCLRRQTCDLDGQSPALEFTARKTGKVQRIPLAPCTVAHVRRLLKFVPGDDLFPCFRHRTMPTRRNRTKPVIGTPSRKALLLRAGFDFPKPWQACRATAMSATSRTGSASASSSWGTRGRA